MRTRDAHGTHASKLWRVPAARAALARRSRCVATESEPHIAHTSCACNHYSCTKRCAALPLLHRGYMEGEQATTPFVDAVLALEAYRARLTAVFNFIEEAAR
jgi:hypothetical protein